MAGTAAGIAKANAAKAAKRAARLAAGRPVAAAELGVKIKPSDYPPEQQPEQVPQVNETNDGGRIVQNLVENSLPDSNEQRTAVQVPDSQSLVSSTVNTGLVESGAAVGIQKIIKLAQSNKVPAAVQLQAGIWLAEANGHGARNRPTGTPAAAAVAITAAEARALLDAIRQHREGRVIEGERLPAADK